MPTFAFKHVNKQANESTKDQNHNTKISADSTQPGPAKPEPKTKQSSKATHFSVRMLERALSKRS